MCIRDRVFVDLDFTAIGPLPDLSFASISDGFELVWADGTVQITRASPAGRVATIDQILLGDESDVVDAPGVAREIRLGGGDDILQPSGSDGFDIARGEAGDDFLSTSFTALDRQSLRGGEGDDALRQRRVDADLTGGDGADTFIITEARPGTRITDFESGVDQVMYTWFAAHGNLVMVPSFRNEPEGVRVLFGFDPAVSSSTINGPVLAGLTADDVSPEDVVYDPNFESPLLL